MQVKRKRPLLDYSRRFKLSREVLASHVGGPFESTKCVEENCAVAPGQTSEEYNKVNEDADEQLAACMCLINSDQNKPSSAHKN